MRKKVVLLIKISFAIMFSILIYFWRGNAMEKLGKEYFYEPKFIIDAISVVGFLYFFLGLLIFVSQKGAFDAGVYGIKKMLQALRVLGEINVEETYFDYVRAREEREKIDYYSFLFIGLIMIAISFILIYFYGLY